MARPSVSCGAVPEFGLVVGKAAVGLDVALRRDRVGQGVLDDDVMSLALLIVILFSIKMGDLNK
jgi:hypothetical protein